MLELAGSPLLRERLARAALRAARAAHLGADAGAARDGYRRRCLTTARGRAAEGVGQTPIARAAATRAERRPSTVRAP